MYTDAVKILNGNYIKSESEIFSRHLAQTLKQRAGESLAQYLKSLKILTKDCTFKAVSATQSKDENICDSFANGIISAKFVNPYLSYEF